MRRILALLCLLALLLALVAVPSGAGASGPMRVGFNVNGPTDQDLAALNATGTAGTFANFATPLDTSQDRPGLLNIRILRYNSQCATMVMSNCKTTISQLGAWVAANPKGQTFALGNEPGNPEQDSKRHIVNWVKNVAATIRANDPTATILGPGYLNWDSSAVALYDQILGSVNVINFHIYPNNSCFGPAGIAEIHQIIDAATSYAAAHGKPAIMSETSDFPGCSGAPANRTAGVADEKAYLASHNVLASIWFTERYLCCYGTGYLFEDSGIPTAEEAGWKNQ